MKELIGWGDFLKVDMRVATIVNIADFPQAKNPAYQLQLDFGPEIGVLKTSAQITLRYTKAELLGRQIIAVVNFPKKQIANFMSECLILGAVDGKDVILLHPDAKVANGLKVG
ncbi:tRNA-binding protein [Cellulophaga sp. F20128]|uniref:tRNA-binding protein n=1 Tax=Cellulophaga sp. F20128 TaxID=2926413 RepID=UPI001FF2A25C|nr:tRNA-binding protein [Cellulophaga sp. F20128]MCK0157710.1 tRNA-binding protein [Cellulophaga sp. F20128]